MLRLRKQPAPISIRAPGRQGQPAAGLEQGAFADRQPPLVERLQHLALDRVADEEAAAGGVAVDPPAPQAPVVALVPAPLRPPDPPTPLSARPPSPNVSHRGRWAGIRHTGYRPVDDVDCARGRPARRHRPRRDEDPDGDRRRRPARCWANRGARRRPAAARRTSPRRWPTALREAAEQAGVETSALEGVGVGSPGDADEKTGVVTGARNLPGWEGSFPLAEDAEGGARDRGPGRQRRPGRDRGRVPPRRRARVREPDRRLLGHRGRRRAGPRRQALARPRRGRRDRPHGRQARRRQVPLRAQGLHGGLRGPLGDGSGGAAPARGGRQDRPLQADGEARANRGSPAASGSGRSTTATTSPRS